MIPPFAAIITAAGASARFLNGRIEDVKKEYLSIDGHTVLYKATKPFFEIPGLSAVAVTYPEGSEDEAAVALEDLMDIQTVPMILVPGGDTRTDSVRKALEALRTLPASFDYIAIHDGARPFATKELIIRTLATAAVVGGAAPATRVTDALRTLSPDGMISSTVDKSSIIALQTPQIFSADKLFDAYDAFHGSADDDGVGAPGDLVVKDLPQHVEVDAAVLVHRGDDGHAGTRKNRLFHHNKALLF